MLSSTTRTFSACSAAARIRFDGNGHKRDGTEQADLQSLRARLIDRRAQHARHDAVADDDQFGVFGAVLFPARLGLLGANVLRFHAALVLFQIIGLEEDGADQVLARLGGSLHRPRFFGSDDLAILEVQRLHHLADESVGQDDGGIAVVVGQFEGEDGEVGHLLHRGRSQHEVAIVAMASALDHGEVVALLGSDVAQAGTAAHHVDDDAGQFGARKIGDAFLHQAQARAGGGGHDAHARPTPRRTPC